MVGVSVRYKYPARPLLFATFATTMSHIRDPLCLDIPLVTDDVSAEVENMDIGDDSEEDTDDEDTDTDEEEGS